MCWRWAAILAMVVSLGSSVVAAQEQPNIDDLNRKYQDALSQLKAAQDRKNELATENDQLKARIAELEKQAEEARRLAAGYAEQTYFLRLHYSAWQGFIARYPQFAERWRAFLRADVLAYPWQAPEPVNSGELASEPSPRTTDAK